MKTKHGCYYYFDEKPNVSINDFNTSQSLIPTKAKLGLYKTSVLPQLTYCYTVWHFCKASDRRKLERVQERALRAIFNTKAHSYEELLNRENLSTLYNRRLQDIAILMFKVKNNISPLYVNRIFETVHKGYGLHNADFHRPRFNTVQYGKHALRTVYMVHFEPSR